MAAIHTYGTVAYDKSSQSTKISQLQVWEYPFFLSEKQLFIGSNPARVAAFFKHIGVQYMSLRTYYKIQRVYLAPAVNRCWENEQPSLLQSLQGKTIALGGDGRCDSPGHSAKYGAYHLVELDLNKVLVVELVQVSITFLRLHFMQSTLIFVITVYAPVQSSHEK